MRKVTYDRQNLSSDITAGTASAFVTIPDGLASAVLAGVNPMQGLYALMIGTPIAALTLSSEFMYVANTGAMAVATGDALSGLSGVDQLQALGILALMVGLIQFLLGILRLGGITKFVSNAVMVGFMTGIALLIILGQLKTLTGYDSPYANDVLAGLDTLLNFQSWNLATFAVGTLTIGLIVGLSKTRLKDFNMILAILLGSLVTGLFNLGSVQTIGDIADIPRGFPTPTVPDFSLIPLLLPSAMALAIIGLVQAMGVSKTVPNSDGNFSNASRDFTGQGLANVANGFFQALPIGGTMSETSVSISAGAKTRFANIFSGILIIIVVLLFGNLVERIAMPTIAALLMVAGYDAIKPEQVKDVRDIGAWPRAIMGITFVATLIWPLQYAVLIGIILSILQYLGQSAADVRLMSLEPQADGTVVERTAPEN
ncbi:MAG: SulP family inorganic anion transporter [Anaerolineae bacterium]|nr:SulP family inorganic anion transporter [Anaerolineae bacterium]